MRILDRSILGDVLRTAAIATAVLVTVIAFGAALKPLARDDLLTVGQAITYVTLAMVPMLQFALPFAAGFAATMTLHRMAEDNELVAAAGAGVGHARILAPIAALGLVLGGLMTGYVHQVVPRFWLLLEEAVARDAALLLEASIGRGEPFRLGDLRIWADDLVVRPADDGADGRSRMVLFRVAVADLDDEGRVVTDVTAERVEVEVSRSKETVDLTLSMDEAVAYRPSDGVLAGMERPEPTTIQLPRVVQRGIKGMTHGQLVALRAAPDDYRNVGRARHDLADRLSDRMLFESIDAQLRRDGVARLRRASTRTTVEVVADACERGRFHRMDGTPVEIVERLGGTAIRRYRAVDARLESSSSSGLRAVALGLSVDRTDRGEPRRHDLVLADAVFIDLEAPDAEHPRAELVLEGLDADAGADAPGDLRERPGDELLALADVRELERDAGLARAVETFRRKRGQLVLEIDGEIAQRYAMACTTPLLLLLGAILGMGHRGSSPLAVYLWAFLPSILDLLLISSGEHVITNGAPAAGYAVMWSGNAVLAAIALRAFLVLRRN